MTNLDYFNEQLGPFTNADRDSIRNYLLGILSVGETSDAWKTHVEMALQCHHNIQVHMAKIRKEAASV